MKKTKIEQETIILFNEKEATAEIYTHNAALKERLRRYAGRHPGLAMLKEDGGPGEAATCEVDKRRLSIVLTDPPSPERSEKARAKMAEINRRREQTGQ